MFRRISGIGRLNPRRLATAQILAAWREERARERDLPRNFVLRESSLLAIARLQPTSRPELSDIPDLGSRQAERLADRILGIVKQARQLPAADLPSQSAVLPRGEQVKKTLNSLVEAVQQRAEELDIPATALASRREIKILMLAAIEGQVDPPPSPFDGWRWDVIGQDLLALI